MLTEATEGHKFTRMTPAAFLAALDEKGITTQTEAAAELGVTKGAVSRWLNGHRPIPPMATMALASIKPKRKRKAAK